MILLLGAALAVVAALLEGLVLSVMWGWFIVPLGVPAIRVPVAIGIALVVGMLTHQQRGSNDNTEWGELVLGGLIGPPMILAVGWLVKQFV